MGGERGKCMNSTEDLKHAVVLSGGGANGAYEVGVLKALFAGKSRQATGEASLDPYIFAGTSVGSYNAAFLVSRWGMYGSAAIASLEQLWLEHLSSSSQKPQNGVFRIREDPREFVNPRSFILNPLEPVYHLVSDSAALTWDGLQRAVNLVTAQTPLIQRVSELFDFTSFIVLEPFRQLVKDTIWFSEIRRSQKKLMVAATNWELGRVRIFENQDMTDQLGPLAILGSSAIPGIFPPTPVGAQLHADGGVLLNTPLNPVIDAGARVLHVISLFPNVANIPLATMSNTLATAYRQQIIGWAKTLESSIKRVRDINWALGFVALTTKVIQRVQESFSAADLESLRLKDIERYLEQYKAYTPITVHQYYPGDDLSGPLGLLDFDRGRIEELIEQGFEDGAQHDCNVNQCVKPSAEWSAELVASRDGLLEF
jgi:predicted acylesterase/phospholipase RssA